MRKSTIVLLVGICLSGCGGVKLNPFSDKGKTNTGYQTYMCNENKQFKLKMIDQNQHAWLQLVDHEVYLTQLDEGSQEYANDHYVLRLNKEQVTITHAGDLQYSGCHTTL